MKLLIGGIAFLTLLAIVVPFLVVSEPWGYGANLLAEAVGIVGAFAAAWIFFERRAQKWTEQTMILTEQIKEWTEIERQRFEERQILVDRILDSLRYQFASFLYTFTRIMAGRPNMGIDSDTRASNREYYGEDWKVFEQAAGIAVWKYDKKVTGMDGPEAKEISEFMPDIESVRSLIARARQVSKFLSNVSATHPWIATDLPAIESTLRHFSPAMIEWLEKDLSNWVITDDLRLKRISREGKGNVANLGRMALHIVAFAEERLTGWKPHEFTRSFAGVIWRADYGSPPVA